MFCIGKKQILFNPFAAVALFFVLGKLFYKGAGEFTALPTLLMPLILTTGFYRAAFAPKWLINMYAAVTSYLLLVSALFAQEPTSRFNHSINLHVLIRITYQTSHLSVMFPVLPRKLYNKFLFRSAGRCWNEHDKAPPAATVFFWGADGSRITIHKNSVSNSNS